MRSVRRNRQLKVQAGTVLAAVCGLLASTQTLAGESDEHYSPYERPRAGVTVYDMPALINGDRSHLADPVLQPDLDSLDALQGPAPEPDLTAQGTTPDGFIQKGNLVIPEDIALGLKQVDPQPSPAWEDIEGNQYPRKHTIFLNFNGLPHLAGGADNSAEDKSSLGKWQAYPAYTGGLNSALAIIQSVEEDVSPFGLRVKYETRPNKTVPYSMAMIGGAWTDTNIDSPAGGVAPGADCEARGQRHVVYAFGLTSSSTVGQELAHAWGLDHLFGTDMIMSYQGSGNKDFAAECRTLCEAQCQGPNSIGCNMIHQKYCPEGEQNDTAELDFIFGTNEPDTEPPSVAITQPADGSNYSVGTTVGIVGDISDNYGGVGWKIYVWHDGELVIDEVDYDRNMAWNLSNAPAGTYEIQVEAEDHADHIVAEKITITVSDDAPATTGDPPDTGAETDAETDGTGATDTNGP
ncbi:MAG: Ig-like domain-containing protein, partial [Nannocystaceae bacterium]